MKQPLDYDPHGGADCYGNADGTGGSQAKHDFTRTDEAITIALLACYGAGVFLVGIGLAYLIEYFRS